MTTELMERILMRLDRKVQYDDRKVLLFIDNVPSHPEILQSKLSNIKFIFLSKRTTSRLQPLDPVVMRSNQIVQAQVQKTFVEMRHCTRRLGKESVRHNLRR